MLIDPYRFVVGGGGPEGEVTLQDHNIDIHYDMDAFGGPSDPAESSVVIAFGKSTDSGPGPGVGEPEVGSVLISIADLVGVNSYFVVDSNTITESVDGVTYNILDEWVDEDLKPADISQTYDIMVASSGADFVVTLLKGITPASLNTWYSMDDELFITSLEDGGEVDGAPSTGVITVSIRDSVTLDVVGTGSFTVTHYFDNF